MDSYNKVSVSICGKTYDLKGDESQTYLNMVGQYIENKYKIYSENKNFTYQSIDMQHMLLQLNIADDYFKEKEKNTIKMIELADKEREIIEIRRELVEARVMAENYNAEIRELQRQLQEVNFNRG